MNDVVVFLPMTYGASNDAPLFIQKKGVK